MFIDPKSGEDRWLIRTAMQGRLPDQVRCQRRLGIQAGDLPVRLRHDATALQACLTTVERSDAARNLVDCAKVRECWQRLQQTDSGRSLRQSGAIIQRGLMAGLFLRDSA